MSALTEAQKKFINDRFQMDAEALLNPQGLLLPTGLPAKLGDLWSQILDARRRYLSVPIPTLTANTTNKIVIAAIARYETVVKATIAFGARPTSAGGTVLATLRQRIGAGAAVDVSALSVDLETLVAANDTAYDLTMPSAVATRRLAPGEQLYIDIISNNGDMAGGTGGVITVELVPTEVAP